MVYLHIAASPLIESHNDTSQNISPDPVAMSLFKHRPLNLKSKGIRLLRLEVPKEETSPVRLIIEHGTLWETKFNAISYEWGPETPIFEITIIDESGDTSIFTVRKNLYEFFIATRKAKDKWTTAWVTEWIWIDQICINQADHDERCHQVAQMSELYRACSNTIIWPGTMPGIDDSPRIKIEAGNAAITCGSASALLSFLSTNRSNLVHPEYAWDLFKRIAGDSIPTLLSKGYWSRLWIVQEIARANIALIFLTTGTYRLDDLVFTIFLVRELFRQKGMPVNPFRPDAHLLFRLYGLRNTYVESLEKGELLQSTWPDVLFQSEGTFCKEPLDRIYALMGLVDPELSVTVDYRVRPEDLIKEVLRKQIAYWKDGDPRIFWPGIARIFQFWSECFPHTLPALGVRVPETSLPPDYLPMLRIHNLSLDLFELGLIPDVDIPFPSSPDEMDPVTFDEEAGVLDSTSLPRFLAYMRLRYFLVSEAPERISGRPTGTFNSSSNHYENPYLRRNPVDFSGSHMILDSSSQYHNPYLMRDPVDFRWPPPHTRMDTAGRPRRWPL